MQMAAVRRIEKWQRKNEKRKKKQTYVRTIMLRMMNGAKRFSTRNDALFNILKRNKISTSDPKKSTDRSIDRNGKRDSCQEVRISERSQLTNQSIAEIYCENSSLWRGSEDSFLSSEIRWMLAINVCFDSPEFKAW